MGKDTYRCQKAIEKGRSEEREGHQKKFSSGITLAPFYVWPVVDNASQGGTPAWPARAAHCPIVEEIDEVQNFA